MFEGKLSFREDWVPQKGDYIKQEIMHRGTMNKLSKSSQVSAQRWWVVAITKPKPVLPALRWVIAKQIIPYLWISWSIDLWRYQLQGNGESWCNGDCVWISDQCQSGGLFGCFCNIFLFFFSPILRCIGISETYPGEFVRRLLGDTFRFPLCLCLWIVTGRP